jgi:hypothetical protein
MEVDPVLILGVGVDIIVREPTDCREFMPGLGVEIRISKAAIHHPMPKARIRQPRRFIGSDGYVSGNVGHEVMGAGVPTQRELRDQVSETRHGVADAIKPRPRKREWSDNPVKWRNRERSDE